VIGDILSMIFPLVGTVCVILLTYYASKWYARRMGSLSGGKHIKIVDRQFVSKTGSILIIDIEGRQYLIGVNEQTIQVLEKLEKPVYFEREPEIPKPDFLKLLKNFTHKDNDNAMH
jgi:flagellar protein FliO/FliZ